MVDHDLTVIIRTTGRPTLQRAVDSVSAQRGVRAAVVVVDALGTLDPSSLRGCTPFSVRWVRGSSPGVLHRAAAAQCGFDAVDSPWALFLDDDDELLEGHLAKLWEAVTQISAEGGAAVAAYTGVGLCQHPNPEAISEWNRRFEGWELLAANPLPIHSVLWNVERARSAGVCFDLTLDVFEDWDFWLQLHTVGEFVHVPGVSARYWLTEPAAQSQAQSASHGSLHHRRIWERWWSRVPESWRESVLRAARDEPLLRAQWVQTRAAHEQAEQAFVTAQLTIAQSNQALALAEQAYAQAQAYEAGLQQQLDHAQRLQQAQAKLLVDLAEVRDAAQEALRAALGREDTLKQQLLTTQQAHALAEHHLRATRASRSWRVMAPFRWLGRQTRRVMKLQDPSARRDFWWRMRHRSYRRPVSLGLLLPDPYEAWMAAHDGNGGEDRSRALLDLSQRLPSAKPLFSVVMPCFNPPLAFLDEAIESLRAQWYPQWELCIADDASTHPEVLPHLRAWAQRESRIRLVACPENGHISRASNAALTLAQGEWVVLFDQDDLLSPQALWRLVEALDRFPDAGILYSDEDKIDEQGCRFGPYFKPAFDIHLLRSQNMVSHLGAYRRSLVSEVGGFREGYEGSQDHDLVLRCVERLRPDQVIHIPRVLYHWRVHAQSTASGQDAKPYAIDASRRAVQDHLDRLDIPATVREFPGLPHHAVVYQPLTKRHPEVHRTMVWGTAEAAFPSWEQACAQMQVWAQLDAEEGIDRPVLVIHQGLVPALQDSSCAEVWGRFGSLIHEPAVGAVAWALRDAGGALHSAGWTYSVDASAAGAMSVCPIDCGTGPGTHGYYGHLSLPHRVAGVSAAAVLLKPSALDPSRGGWVLRPECHLVWSPQVQWHNIPRAAFPVSDHGVRTAAFGTGIADLWFSPHLSVHPADHRLAPAVDSSRDLRPRTSPA